MRIISFISLILASVFTSHCNSVSQSSSEKNIINTQKQTEPMNDKNLKVAYFASGCFWCVEAIYQHVEGVSEVISGYSGGKEENPTYEQVSNGRTGHAEAVAVYYDSAVVTYVALVEVFFGTHDPTTVNGQAPDYGRQYRSAIFYQDDVEKNIATKFRDDLNASGKYSKPIATEIVAFDKFWVAEDYHQDFEKRNPNQPYIQGVSVPRLNRFKENFPDFLKKE